MQNSQLEKDINRVYPLLIEIAKSTKYEDYEDLAHDVVEGFIRKAVVPAFHKPYLWRCIQNMRISNWRKWRVDIEAVQPQFSFNDIPEETADNLALKEHFEAAMTNMQNLPEKHQQVLTLRMEGLSYKEIARKTGIPIGTVRSRIYHARSKSHVSAKSKRRQSKAS